MKGRASQLDIRGVQRGTALRIVVEGELDLAGVPDLAAVIEVLAEPGMTITLDVTGLGFVDIAGMHELHRLRAVGAARGWSLELVGVSPALKALADACAAVDLAAGA